MCMSTTLLDLFVIPSPDRNILCSVSLLFPPSASFPSESKADSKWPGVALVLNVVLQLVAAIIMRATRIQSY